MEDNMSLNIHAAKITQKLSNVKFLLKNYELAEYSAKR